MLGRVKKWLGIEGVKLELLIPETISSNSGQVDGKIHLFSMHAQTVTFIKVIMIERYTRGRGKEKLIDEYQLGELHIKQDIDIPENEIIEVDFSLSFTPLRSDIDDFGNRNLVFGSLARAAKMIRGAKSEFRIEAEARVRGTALNPFDRKQVQVK